MLLVVLALKFCRYPIYVFPLQYKPNYSGAYHCSTIAYWSCLIQKMFWIFKQYHPLSNKELVYSFSAIKFVKLRQRETQGQPFLQIKLIIHSSKLQSKNQISFYFSSYWAGNSNIYFWRTWLLSFSIEEFLFYLLFDREHLQYVTDFLLLDLPIWNWNKFLYSASSRLPPLKWGYIQSLFQSLHYI